MNPETTGRSPRHFVARRLLIVLVSSLLGLALALGLLAGLDTLNLVRAAWAATTITVNTTNDELNSDGDCSLREAIQAANTDTAVDACPAGSSADTINLPAGTYTLTLAGADEDGNATGDLDITGPLTLDGADMATTVINANSLDRALHVPTAGVTLTLLNLTVRNGFPYISVWPYQSGSGGGLYAAGPAVVSNIAFLNNTAGYAGAGGGAYFADTATVMGTTFMNNNAITGDYGDGGGAYFAGAATVIGTTFLGNIAGANGPGYGGGDGGGAYFQSAATVTSTTFLSNRATVSRSSGMGGNGGGAYFYSPAAIAGTTFISNTAGYGGGAFFRSTATVTMTGSTFLGNTAGGGGGAAFIGGAMVTGTIFIRNTAGYGGGAHFQNTATVMDTTFQNNISNGIPGGGGAFFLGSETTAGDFVNTLFAANHSAFNRGAGLYAENNGGDDVVTLRHVTIVSPTVGSGSAVYVRDGTVNITNTIVASYTVGLEHGGGVLNETYNLFSSVTTPYSGTVVSGGNSITGTAAFADATPYKLTGASAAIDTGTDVGIASDFEGDPRPAGAGFDIGWDEADVPISGLSASNDSPKQVVQAIHFTATISAGTGVRYQWNFGDNSPILTGNFCPRFPGLAEVEPNNAPSQANGPLCSGLDYSGAHNDPDDFFRFSLGTGGTITVSLTPSAPDPQLLLYYGSSTGYVQVGHRGAPPFVINYTGAAGVYYLRVVTGCSPSCPNLPYVLRVTYPFSTLQFPTHTYAAVGNYTAIVTATNRFGSVSASTPVTITQAAFNLYLPLITRNVSPGTLAPQGGSAPSRAGRPVPSRVVRLVDSFPKV